MPEDNYKSILIVHNYYQIPGGEDLVVKAEHDLLSSHGHRVILYTRNNNEFREASALKKLSVAFSTVFSIRTYREIRRIIRENDIDIVHVHNTLNLISPAVYYAALREGAKVVQTVHNFRLICPVATLFHDGMVCEECIEKGLGCAVRKGCYRNSRAQTLVLVASMLFHRMTGIYKKINYICLTDFNKQKILANRQIDPSRVYVKPNFVAPYTGIIPNDREGFIFAGRLDDYKGIRVMTEAWKKMGKDAPHLTIFGTGPLEEELNDAIREFGLNIDAPGYIDNQYMRDEIARRKAMILPTLLYEGFPVSIVEAYSTGTPVIASDIGNAGALVTDGVTGYRFECGNADALIKALNNNMDLNDSVMKAYERSYTAEANYGMLMDIYDRL